MAPRLESTETSVLCPFGGDPQKPRETCVTWNDFAGFARGLPNVRLFLFVDACRSAALASDDQAANAILSATVGGVVFAACGRRQHSFESSRWKHGAFSLAILEALENRCLLPDPWPKAVVPDLDEDGYLAIEELALFIRARVRQLTGDRQSPDYTKPSMGVSPILF